MEAKEIERSIMTTYRSRLWTKFIKAIKTYELIREHDKICVCISGGKDSMIMAKLFQELHKHSEFEFEVRYLVMNPGYNAENLTQIKKNLQIMQIDAQIYDTNIFEVANSQEKNPCYMCARMRRGCLYDLAREMGCNKIALGHHFDDVIETTLMNMLNSGSFQTMLPKLHSDNFENMELIRPMYLIREKDIINFSKAHGLEFIRCACRFTENIEKNKDHDTNSQRYQTKLLIQNLKSYCNDVEQHIFTSANNINMDMILGYKKDGIKHSFLENYDDKNTKQFKFYAKND